jgi:hypothetical protein
VQSTTPHHRDYQWEGVAIGAIVGAIVGGTYCAIGFRDFGEPGDSPVGFVAAGALIVGAVGGVLGGVVGALISKKPAPSTL